MLMLLQVAILIMIKLPGKYRQDKRYSHLRLQWSVCKISYLVFIIQSRRVQEKSQTVESNKIKPEHNMGSHLNEKSQFHLKEPITNRYLIGI